MEGSWLAGGIMLIIGLALLMLGLRRSPEAPIDVAQRTFFISFAVGALIAAVVPQLDSQFVTDVLIFVIVICGETALLSLAIWRFPRLTRSLVDSNKLDTPTT